MESIWKKSVELPKYESLLGEIKTDVLIIGGGIAGILCAYMLKNSGVDCVIAEAEEICSKTTGNTTAKITFQHGLIYDKIINSYGLESAKLYFESNKAAVEKYRLMCRKTDCDFKECRSFVYSVKDAKKIEKEARALQKIGCRFQLKDKISFDIPVAQAIGVENQARFNPLKFITAIIEDLKIYENTRVLELQGTAAITPQGKIKAKKIIVATHFPFINKHGSYFIKMYQHRSYAAGFVDVPLIDDMYVDEDKKGFSFRVHGDVLLVGGGGHRTGKKGRAWADAETFMKEKFPAAKEVCRFATQDCITLDQIPYIGRYSKNTPDIFVATGFNKWGMTSSMVSAMLLSDLIVGKENKYETLYSPSRSMLHPQLAVNALEAAGGILRPTKPRCPHLGCALKYNPNEHSWDCSCHGSRFSEEGRVLDNPANGDK